MILFTIAYCLLTIVYLYLPMDFSNIANDYELKPQDIHILFSICTIGDIEYLHKFISSIRLEGCFIINNNIDRFITLRSLIETKNNDESESDESKYDESKYDESKYDESESENEIIASLRKAFPLLDSFIADGRTKYEYLATLDLPEYAIEVYKYTTITGRIAPKHIIKKNLAHSSQYYQKINPKDIFNFAHSTMVEFNNNFGMVPDITNNYDESHPKFISKYAVIQAMDIKWFLRDPREWCELPCYKITVSDCNLGADYIINKALKDNVKYIDVSNNKLESLDVRLCKNLEYLDVSTNMLTILSLRGNRKLQTLKCHNNQIKVLSFKKNPHLEYIDASNNNIHNINISELKHLEVFKFSSNHITHLTLPKRDYNRLTYIDVSGNNLRKLSHIELHKLLKYVNLSNNKLSGNIKFSLNVVELYIDRNRVKSLKLTDCIYLDKLSAYSNKISKINLSTNESLKYINLRKNQLQEIIFPEVTRVNSGKFDPYRSIKFLDISQNETLEKLCKSKNAVSGNGKLFPGISIDNIALLKNYYEKKLKKNCKCGKCFEKKWTRIEKL